MEAVTSFFRKGMGVKNKKIPKIFDAPTVWDTVISIAERLPTVRADIQVEWKVHVTTSASALCSKLGLMRKTHTERKKSRV